MKNVPLPTLLLIAFLSATAAVLFWFKTVKPILQPASRPVPSPSTILNLPKVPKPEIPDVSSPSILIKKISQNLLPGAQPQTSLPVYQTTPVSLQDLAASISQKLRLPSTDSSTWGNPSSALSLSPQNDSFSYHLNLTVPKSGPQLFIDQATVSAARFLKNVGLTNPGYQLDVTGVSYLTSDNLNLVPLSRAQSASGSADVIELPYRVEFHQLPLIVSNYQYPLRLRIDRNQKVIYLFATMLPSNSGSGTSYPLISLNQAASLLQSGTGKLIIAEPLLPYQAITSTTLLTANLTNSSLVYYYPPSGNLIYPAYLITGSGTFSDGTQATLTFILPAIDPRYYK